MTMETDRRLEPTGPRGALRDAIALHTGAAPAPAGEPVLRAALAAAFPDLPIPDSLEGCTDHAALTLRFRVPGFGREAVKLVLRPFGDLLEARARLEVPGGSYRGETLQRLLDFLARIEAALDA